MENKAAELNEKVSILVETLAAETDQARRSESVTNYLNFAASFYHYSAFNQFLIMMSGATLVAGYHDWLKKGRPVCETG